MGCLGVYNRDAAVAYARQYALNYNSQYDDYASGGGDCMNFVSQCLYAGGIPMKDYGHLWYCNSNESSDSWRGVDSFLAFLRKSFGSPHLLIECHDTPVNLKKGDIVFTVADGAPGNIARNPSHIVILSEDYATYGALGLRYCCAFVPKHQYMSKMKLPAWSRRHSLLFRRYQYSMSKGKFHPRF